MAEKSRILIIGGTGYIGRFIVEASAKAGHPTFALVREGTVSDPAKAQLVDKFKQLGVTLVHGDVNDHESLVKAIKQVDVVISTIGSMQIADQTKIIAAIKEAGNVKVRGPTRLRSGYSNLVIFKICTRRRCRFSSSNLQLSPARTLLSFTKSRHPPHKYNRPLVRVTLAGHSLSAHRRVIGVLCSTKWDMWVLKNELGIPYEEMIRDSVEENSGEPTC